MSKHTVKRLNCHHGDFEVFPGVIISAGPEGTVVNYSALPVGAIKAIEASEALIVDGHGHLARQGQAKPEKCAVEPNVTQVLAPPGVRVAEVIPGRPPTPGVVLGDRRR